MSQVEEFCAITSESESVAIQYLARNRNDLNAAVNHYFETGGQLPEQPQPSTSWAASGFRFNLGSTRTSQPATASTRTVEEQPAQAPAPRVWQSEIEPLRDSKPRMNSQWKAKVGPAPAKQQPRVDDPCMFLVPPAQKQTRNSFVIRKKDVIPRRPYQDAPAENPST